MRIFWSIGICLLGVACSKDSPRPPASALLEFPLKNSECTTGESTSLSTTSLVEFRWTAADRAETYELRVTNLTSNNTQTINVAVPSAQLPLIKGAPYSWAVISRTSKVTETATSETWLFYNAGAATTYPPFPADMVSPKQGTNVSKDINNEVLLDWDGADVDNDIAGYTVYFSTSNPPETPVASLASNSSQVRVSVTSQTVYYWRVITTDSQGNSADSGVFEFRVF
jgi:hypothetical protein